MPFLEFGAQYNSINFNCGPYVYMAPDVNANDSMATKVNTYVCPSDLPNYPPFDPSKYFGTAQTSYGMVLGNTEILLHVYQNPPTTMSNCGRIAPDGPFGIEFTYRTVDITDGLSNTLFFGETSRFTNEPSTFGTLSSFFNTWVTTGGFCEHGRHERHPAAGHGLYRAADQRPGTAVLRQQRRER